MQLQYNTNDLWYRPSNSKFRSALYVPRWRWCSGILLRRTYWRSLHSNCLGWGLNPFSALQAERSNQSATVPHLLPGNWLTLLCDIAHVTIFMRMILIVFMKSTIVILYEIHLLKTSRKSHFFTFWVWWTIGKRKTFSLQWHKNYPSISILTEIMNKNYLHVWNRFVTNMYQKYDSYIHNLHEILLKLPFKVSLI